MKGKVKFFNVMKGFGFIAGDDGKEYFVHKTGLTKGTLLRENDTVTFNPAESDKGPKAENVALESAAGKTAQKEEATDAPEAESGEECACEECAEANEESKEE
jgi:CspA family cold shock protein